MCAHISKLHLFAKDTDAPDTIKGFRYQELKTLEVWLYNKVHNVNEHIYCDFEDDIFQRDLTSFKSTFKQLKLYSSKNFSFSSEEVKKSLAHFFMLYVKGEYLLDEPLFIFETNTSIAAKRGNNDAELLAEWASNHAELSGDLLTKCSTKIKTIIDSYVQEQYEKRETDGDNEELLIAKDTYDKLPDVIWESFTKSIRWVFGGISSDEAIDISIENSFELIRQLPFPIEKDEHSLVFDRLRGVVGDKSMESDPQNRLLTNDLLDSQLLSLGSKDDKVYLEAYELWKDIEDIPTFNIAEFYQVLFAAKHCRRNSYLEGQSEIWLNLMTTYCNHTDILRKLKREAIYEIVWLSTRPSVDEAPRNSLKGLEEIVYDYFSDIGEFTDLESLEDALNLLTVVASIQKFDLIEIEEGQIIEWFGFFDSIVDAQKVSAADKNIYCGLLEVEGFCHLNKGAIGIGSGSRVKALACFNEIIVELPNAVLYAVSQLGKRIDGIINLAIRFGIDDDFTNIEKFSESLLPKVLEREGDFSAAKRYVERGIKYLNTSNPADLLKALDYFHKAKDLYNNQDYSEGFILALINISQLYSAIGMNLAAKYYSLIVIWYCFQTEDPKLLKRIGDSYGLLLHYEFKQGSWLNYLQALENYITAKNEFGSGELDPERDDSLAKTLVESAFILASTPIISNQLSGFIQFEKTRMSEFYTMFLEESVDSFQKLIDRHGVNSLMNGKVDNPPINDIGATRTLTWKAFGSLWNVEFVNDYINNSVGEEFASFIQIIQSEVALRNTDFHLIKSHIRMKIELVEAPKSPEELPSSSESVWKVFIPVLNSKNSKEKNMHYAMITAAFQRILDDLSLLPNEDFKSKYHSLFENGLGNRTLTTNAYQRAYRDVFSQKQFSTSRRNQFAAYCFEMDHYESETLLPLNNTSPLYNRNESIDHIRGRYRNLSRSIHLTINRLNQTKLFNERLKEFRRNGWLDWQVLLALYNHINNLKANNALRQNKKAYANDEERLQEFRRLHSEIIGKDESETFVEIPIQTIIGEDLDFHLAQTPMYVLNSFGLENKSRFQNPEAVRTFLSERFNFEEDEIQELSPFNNDRN